MDELNDDSPPLNRRRANQPEARNSGVTLPSNGTSGSLDSSNCADLPVGNNRESNDQQLSSKECSPTNGAHNAPVSNCSSAAEGKGMTVVNLVKNHPAAVVSNAVEPKDLQSSAAIVPHPLNAASGDSLKTAATSESFSKHVANVAEKADVSGTVLNGPSVNVCCPKTSKIIMGTQSNSVARGGDKLTYDELGDILPQNILDLESQSASGVSNGKPSVLLAPVKNVNPRPKANDYDPHLGYSVMLDEADVGENQEGCDYLCTDSLQGKIDIPSRAADYVLVPSESLDCEAGSQEDCNGPRNLDCLNDSSFGLPEYPLPVEPDSSFDDILADEIKEIINHDSDSDLDGEQELMYNEDEDEEIIREGGSPSNVDNQGDDQELEPYNDENNCEMALSKNMASTSIADHYNSTSMQMGRNVVYKNQIGQCSGTNVFLDKFASSLTNSNRDQIQQLQRNGNEHKTNQQFGARVDRLSSQQHQLRCSEQTSGKTIVGLGMTTSGNNMLRCSGSSNLNRLPALSITNGVATVVPMTAGTGACNQFRQTGGGRAPGGSGRSAGTYKPIACTSGAAARGSAGGSNFGDLHNVAAVARGVSIAHVYGSNNNSVHNWQATKHNLKERMGFMFCNEILADIHFIVGKGEQRQRIPAHKFMLSIGSAVFDAMFNRAGLNLARYPSTNPADDTPDVDVPDVEPAAFMAMLRFLYTDDVQIGPESVMTTLYTAKKYAVPALENACVDFLKRNLSSDNAFMLLTQARLFDEPQLAALCLEMIDKHTGDALGAEGFTDVDLETLCAVLERDTLRIREVVLFQAVVRWSTEECRRQQLPVTPENQRQCLARALQLLRFPLMTVEEFAQSAAQSGILSDREVVTLFLYFTVNPKPSVSFLDVPRCCVTGKEQVVNRFQRIEGRWGYSGTPDRIKFTVDRRIFVVGFGLYGSIHGPTEYQVNIQILHCGTGKIIGANDTSFQCDGSTSTFRVLFKEPVEISPCVTYIASATLKGPDSHYGTKGLRRIVHQSASSGVVTFQFTYAAGNNNGTSVEDGQIPEIIFYTKLGP